MAVTFIESINMFADVKGLKDSVGLFLIEKEDWRA